MKVNPQPHDTGKHPWWFLMMLGLLSAVPLSYVVFVITFLSVTERVDADVLVVEAWIPSCMFKTAAEEFHQGHYSRLIVSGQARESPDLNWTLSSVPASVAQMESLGVPQAALIACNAPHARGHKTAKMPRAVRERIRSLGLNPKGINVLTEGTHAREPWGCLPPYICRESSDRHHLHTQEHPARLSLVGVQRQFALGHQGFSWLVERNYLPVAFLTARASPYSLKPCVALPDV